MYHNNNRETVTDQEERQRKFCLAYQRGVIKKKKRKRNWGTEMNYWGEMDIMINYIRVFSTHCSEKSVARDRSRDLHHVS